MPQGTPASMMGYNVALCQKEFLGFRRMLFEQAGIHLSDAQKTLVSGRLAKRLGQRGIDSYGEYLALIQHDEAKRQMAIDLLTTNETCFYREPQHFDFLAQHVVRGQLHRRRALQHRHDPGRGPGSPALRDPGQLMPHLRDEGLLFISHSESLHGVTDALQMVKPSVDRKR